MAAGNATLPVSANCFRGSAFRQYAAVASAYPGGVAIALALLVSGAMLFTGRHGRPLPRLLGSAVVLLLIGLVIAKD